MTTGLSYLTLGSRATFMLRNSLGFSWHALVSPTDLLRDEDEHDDYEQVGCVFRTRVSRALYRLDHSIPVLRQYPYFWAYFRVLDVLYDELLLCDPDDHVVLDFSGYGEL